MDTRSWVVCQFFFVSGLREMTSGILIGLDGLTEVLYTEIGPQLAHRKLLLFPAHVHRVPVEGWTDHATGWTIPLSGNPYHT